MDCIQNSRIGAPTHFNKTIAGLTCVLTITGIALSIIGLTDASDFFNAMTQIGPANNGVILGASLFLFIFDLVWIAALCQKTNEQPLSQSEPTYSYPSSPSLVKLAAKDLNNTDLFSQKPEEMIFSIFVHLSPTELARCGEVSKRFRQLAASQTLWDQFDLRKIFPELKFFDESDWATHFNLASFGLSLDDATPIDKRTAIPILKKGLSSLSIKEDAGLTFLTIPKGLTPNIFIELAGSPKVGNKIQTDEFFIHDHYLEKYGNIPVDKTYRIVITNHVINNTTHLPEELMTDDAFWNSRINIKFSGPGYARKTHDFCFADQETYLKKMGCRTPKALETLVLIGVTSINSGKRLFDEYTRCSEPLSDGCRPFVGTFGYFGIYSCGETDSYGVGGVLLNF